MSVTAKSIAILIGTLVIGMGVGGVIVGTISNKRSDKLGKMRKPGGFVEHMQEVIEPHDDAQWEKILPYVQKTADLHDSVLQLTHKQLRSALETMKKDLEPILDEDQNGRLSKVGKGKRGRGPGPPHHRRKPPRERE